MEVNKIAKKEMTERIIEAMKDPSRVRNLATASHVHHGKCISKDSRIALVDGSFVRAEDVFKRYAEKGKVVRTSNGELVVDVEDQNINVFSLNKKTLKIEEKSIKYIWKLKTDDDLIKIKSRNGLNISTTPEHKFLVFSGTGIIEKQAKDIKLQDFIICGKNLDAIKKISMNEIKTKILEFISNDLGFYVFLKDDFKEEVKNKILEFGLKDTIEKINTTYKAKESFYYCIYHGRYRVKDLVRLAKIFNFDMHYVYEQIKFLSYRRQLTKIGRSSSKIVLPNGEEEFKSFFYMVGLLFGDGSRTNLTNTNNSIIERFIDACKILGLKPTINKFKKRSPRINSNGGLTLLNFIGALFDYPKYKKASKIRINEFVQTLPLELLVEFIKGYFDTDGTIEKGRSAVSINSKSFEMLKDLQLVLLKFGITSILSYDTLYISGQSGKLFRDHIGFNLESKQERLEELAQKVRFSRVTETYPVDCSMLKNIRISMNANMSNIFPSYCDYETGKIIPTIQSLPKIVSKFSSFHSEESELLKKMIEGDIYLLAVNEITNVEDEFVYDFTIPDNHNFIAEGMVIHNTALTDNLMAGAGMIAEEMAGKIMYTWFDEQERRRQLTIYGANVSMIHEHDNRDFLINLIDTPGHVDFGGDVGRAMRAADGCIILVCAVESIMPQTETVFRQALRERVKPVLFINKVDRLIRELKLSPEDMQKRFEEIIRDVNLLIQKYAEEKYKNKWLVNVADGSVAMGSAVKRWAISIPFMKKTGITFKEIIELTLAGKEDELAKKAPLHQVVLDMLIKHLPNPLEAQKYRLDKVWKGDLESEVGKQMLACDPDGKLAMIITKMVTDPHVGFVATGRLFSGKIFKGKDVYLIGQHKKEKLQQIAVYKGIQRIPIDEVVAGNIAGIIGIPEAFSGETVCEPDSIIEPFEEIKHIFEPVVTKSVEPKNAMELPKLVDTLKKLGREDTTLKVKINQETGEYLISGLGELHLEAKVENKLKELGIDVEMSAPIVVYRETVFGKSPEIEGKSPNRHNLFEVVVEPLEDGVYKAMLDDKLPSDKEIKGRVIELAKQIAEAGMNYDEAKSIVLIHNKNVLMDETKGVQFMNEVMEMVKEAFIEMVEEGPLSKEPCTKVKIKLIDAELHEDPVHRGPGQIIPAVRGAIRDGMLYAGATLLEPKQIIRIDVPSEIVGEVIRETENRRGQILDMKEERGQSMVTAKMPVADMFGFDNSLKSATSGRGFYSLIEIVFEKLPTDLRDKTIIGIRKRKGLTEEIPKPQG